MGSHMTESDWDCEYEFVATLLIRRSRTPFLRCSEAEGGKEKKKIFTNCAFQKEKKTFTDCGRGKNSSRPMKNFTPMFDTSNDTCEWQCWNTGGCNVKPWIPLGGRAKKWTAGLRTANATCSHWRFRLVPSKQSKYFQRNNVSFLIRKKMSWVQFFFFE